MAHHYVDEPIDWTLKEDKLSPCAVAAPARMPFAEYTKLDKELKAIYDKHRYERTTEPIELDTPVKSDGSSTSYYRIPDGATDIIDLIEYKNMNFSIGNIFKACYRLGQKEGNDDAYDLRKIIFFAERELKRLTTHGTL